MRAIVWSRGCNAGVVCVPVHARRMLEIAESTVDSFVKGGILPGPSDCRPAEWDGGGADVEQALSPGGPEPCITSGAI